MSTERKKNKENYLVLAPRIPQQFARFLHKEIFAVLGQ